MNFNQHFLKKNYDFFFNYFQLKLGTWVSECVNYVRFPKQLFSAQSVHRFVLFIYLSIGCMKIMKNSLKIWENEI